MTWRAVDPAAVQARVVAPLGQQGAELIAESAHWAQSFNALSQTWRRSPSAVGAPFTEIRGLPSINDFMAPWRRRERGGADRPAAVRRGTGELDAAGGSASARSRRSSAASVAHALPARRATGGRHPSVRRCGHRRRRGGAHPRRVLQPPARLRPARRGHPRPRGHRLGDGDQRPIDRGLPRRHVRASLGTCPALHQQRDAR